MIRVMWWCRVPWCHIGRKKKSPQTSLLSLTEEPSLNEEEYVAHADTSDEDIIIDDESIDIVEIAAFRRMNLMDDSQCSEGHGRATRSKTSGSRTTYHMG